MLAEPSALLIVANSGRAMAESARRGGYRIAVLDAFCDQDTRKLGPCARLRDAAGCVDADLVLARARQLAPRQLGLGLVYGAGLEDAPSALHRLAGRHRLFGNRPDVLDLLRDARRLFGLLDRLSIPHPAVRFSTAGIDSGRWLLKRAGGNGGQRIENWCVGKQLTQDDEYLQRYLAGPAMSALFIADGREFQVIGYNRLAQSPSADRPFLYAGAINHAPLGQAARRAVSAHIDALVRELGLRGVNSLDFLLHDGRPLVLELNARPTATLELYEQSAAEGWLKAHVRACMGELRNLPFARNGRTFGHRVCYARRDLHVPRQPGWPHWAKDLPAPGSDVASGQPLCSVFADGASTVAVEADLQRRQDRIERMTGRWQTPSESRVDA